MERVLGHDFSTVQVHTGPRAAAAAEAVGAVGFAVGRHLVFQEGAYRPDSPAGRSLLVHELAHVAQSGGRAPDATGGITIAPADSAAEHEAEHAEARVSAGLPPILSPAGPSEAALLHRRLVVGNPGGHPSYGPPDLRTSTHAALVTSWLGTLCPAANATVSATNGLVTVGNAELCARVTGSLDRERRERRTLTRNTPAPTDANPISCECLCQAVSSPATIDLNVDDTIRASASNRFSGTPDRSVANAGEGATLKPGQGAFEVSNPTVVVSGRGTTVPGPGGRISDPPWLILAHEICGHVLSDPVREAAGDLAATNEESHAQTEEGDRSTVDIENLIRGEHSLQTRRGNAVYYTLQAGDDLAGLERRFGFVGHGRQAWDSGGIHRFLKFTDREFPSREDIPSGQDAQFIDRELREQVANHSGQVLVYGAAWEVLRQKESWSSIARRWRLQPRGGRTPEQRLRDANEGVRLLLMPGARILIPLP